MPWQRKVQSKINEWQSNRNLMNAGGGMAAQGFGNMNTSSIMNNNRGGGGSVNTYQMGADVSAAQNSGQGYDYNNSSSDSSKYTG
jgi:hypothetical protein